MPGSNSEKKRQFDVSAYTLFGTADVFFNSTETGETVYVARGYSNARYLLKCKPCDRLQHFKRFLLVPPTIVAPSF